MGLNKPTRVSNSSAKLIDSKLSNISFVDDSGPELRARVLVTDMSDRYPVFC